MERKGYYLTVFLFLFAISLYGSDKSDIYKAYITNSMSAWKVIVDQLQNKKEKNNEQVLELINYQYGYIGWCLGTKRKEEASDYLKLAEENLKLLESQKPFLAKVNGYKSAFYGFHIGLNIFSAPFIGPKSAACAKESIALDPTDFFGYVQNGNVQLYSPAVFGGSKLDALKNFLKAKVLLENNSLEIKNDWNYLSLLTTIAQTYEMLNDEVREKLIYEEILRIEPDFKWVRDELYPQLIKKNK